ncbi:E3 ubiquitin-protein ligase MARCHF7-like isoform X7 [Varanus komodoensis]|uniref:E3 ubiquitin-protein ligase MARCHF7-like isoform X7 n=1 Tax=Varanus komodoensis TaxID=61221 RepID=UPI001CF7BCB4|nr:E3 ubiquitin-protein ligase MARCHF7-like isoform X7 [Varanus komodoensis]XP_044274030.1 E3 ubiquitin-protein ligase MARCHF7-like isoform X7 [Varanus komodoensis]XP_044274043.1 E3 ubiquitin-protein ligase MARCHF7-like isoform X7 [Varanus komodoensis]XP_044282147.1 E3 ubiquitin-protein ligase MARCHF7-like isoform X7 [Varanus komodoensis]XP_044282688.1 E3 ubiquitin-protein ligase MARCHF7-like isoform X7 [Varanus komodoensis]XP_044282704.1 E3 ubiquitin-protein ligase MARCHF7-like isoform X7 [Va
MESKPSRIPRRVSVQPSSSRSVRTGTGSGGTNITDSYHMRESSLRPESGCQESSRLHSSSRDWAIGESEVYESPWKLPASSPTRYSGTLDRPWSGRFLGSRNRLSTSSSSPLTSSWLGESERTQGAYSSRLHNQQQDTDSKRPKLSYTSTSSVRSNGLNTVSDLQERSASSYAQGARPKENSLSSLRLNTSMNRQLPSEHQSSLLSRDHSWNSRSNYVSRELESTQRNIQPEFSHGAMRSGTSSSSISERVMPSQRSLSEPPADTEGRRTTRQLLSRLASSMSSTFFSRRSSQDSLTPRPLGSEDSTVPRAQGYTQASAMNTATNSDDTEAQTPDVSQGFSFLRRRWGLAGVSQNSSNDSEAESYRHDSENRNAGSWLSSSLRNRCTPLFSRRRREGRDETARTSTSETPARSLHLFRRRESVGETSLEAQNDSPRSAARPSTPAVPNGATSVASGPDSVQGRRNSGISGMFPGSLFRFAVPPTLGNNLSDNVMITVDIIPSGWNQPGGEDSDKSKIPPSRDPERLQKIKESLLSEDSEEEEGDLCRICQMSSTSATNLLIEPCKCTGSLQYVHQECMKKWLQSKINSGSSLEAVTTCELCKEKLHLNLDNFDIHELHRAHANEQADYEFISSGLYLVVLLHLCEQRFSDMLGTTSEANTRVRFINLARTLQAHMDDIETASDDDDSEDGDLSRTLDAA